MGNEHNAQVVAWIGAELGCAAEAAGRFTDEANRFASGRNMTLVL